ncbi:MAG: hypothetical protein LBK60_00480 [Verrucomicrobiales bacterium]|nr:hypothetical protein [Verrucomicrobiales bacterium]
MTKEFVTVRGLPFRVYGTKSGTWKAYYNGKILHRATMKKLRVAMDVHARTLLGESATLTLAVVDAADYRRAREILGPLGVSLADAARHYAAGVGQIRRRVSVSEAVTAFLADKQGTSAVYQQFAKYAFGKFSGVADLPLHEAGGELAKRLRGLAWRGRGFNNARGLMVTFWRWAQGCGHVPDEKRTPFDVVPKKRETDGEVTVFSPAQLARLLELADVRARAFVFLGAFFGLRSAEIARLTGADIHLEHRVVEVAADKAKTGQRRLAPFPAAWRGQLARLAGMEGFWHRNRYEFLRASLAEKLPFPRNVLRHSFISYRLAATGNIEQVAADAGTSREKIYKNYRALRTLDGLPVTARLASKWFALAPSAPL